MSRPFTRALWPAIGLLIPTTASLAAEPAPKAIHPAVRQQAGPAGGAPVAVNPPPLLWPASSNRSATYDVRLAPSPRFPAESTIQAKGLQWAMFNAHQQLAPGTWCWRYGVTLKGKPTEWSKVMRFGVTESSRPFVTPPAEQMLRACPRSRPRVLVTAAELAAFRRRAAKSAQAAAIVRAAKRQMGKDLPSEDSGRPEQKGATKRQKKKFAQWASKAMANRLNNAATALSKAYLVTGDEAFGREAVRVAMHVAGFDPKGVTAPGVSDFADGMCLSAMAVAYDSCHGLLTDAQKAMLVKGIATRAGRMYSRWRNKLETRVFSAHIWQHILHQFVDAAFAVLGDVPEADQWAAYAYELWIACVPLQGGADGGWANGNSYFGTNYRTLTEIPTFFERLTGVSFFGHPWYRNTPAFMLYTWPPESYSDGFGDGGQLGVRPPDKRIGFADALSRELPSPLASWYVTACLKARGRKAPTDGGFAWYRLRTDKKPPPAPETLRLPQARAFADVGVVAMHTDLTHTAGNLMVAFRSSPYGSFNHAHADQNAFNLLFAGRPLLRTSGYYIAYGDPHFMGWYKHTRGHNSVLIDGKGQTFGPEGYGRIARFLHGERISYCLGDASGAYGQAGLTRFRRHVALLRPRTVVVYDDLAADHPAAWTWLAHSPSPIAHAGARLTVAAEHARTQVDLWGSTPLTVHADNVFDPPADNWRKKKNRDGSVKQYPNQWHARASSANIAHMRYLAVIQVRPNGQAAFAEPTTGKDGWLTVGEWRIRAELDAARPATLEARHATAPAALGVDVDALAVGGETCRAEHKPSTLLVEGTDAKRACQQCVDQWPAAAR